MLNLGLSLVDGLGQSGTVVGVENTNMIELELVGLTISVTGMEVDVLVVPAVVALVVVIPWLHTPLYTLTVAFASTTDCPHALRAHVNTHFVPFSRLLCSHMHESASQPRYASTLFLVLSGQFEGWDRQVSKSYRQFREQ